MDSININILHVVRSFDVSGRSRLIRAICRGCVMDGVTSAVVSLSNNCGYKQSDVDVVSLGIGGGFKLSAIFKLVKMIRYRKVNVVHSHGRGSLIYAALACMFLPGVRLIHTVHRADGDLVSRHDVLRGLVLGRADHLVAVSRSAASEFAAVNKCSVDEIKVIYNGIDLSAFEVAGARNVIDDGKPIVIGTVANLSSDKDVETLLMAFAKMQDSVGKRHALPLQFRIIGDGPRSKELHEFAKDLGIYENVDFMGFRKDVPEQLAKFDVFVLSTKTEGFGISI
ncbi:MAG: glycosyltransferase, partial [Kiritimatiellae bacterium]|nr:glycosyltransferase [Kiritimatiellia bacterium]